MTPRTIEEIEKAFREIGLDETKWGKEAVPSVDLASQPASPAHEQTFIRIETTTTPLEPRDRADLA